MVLVLYVHLCVCVCVCLCVRVCSLRTVSRDKILGFTNALLLLLLNTYYYSVGTRHGDLLKSIVTYYYY